MDVQRIIDQFTEAWNVEDPEERRRLIEATCTEGTEISSPYGEHQGIDTQLREIAEVRAQFPKLICKGKVVAEHHRWVLDFWTTEFGGARPPLHGVDVTLLSETGRVVKVISFSPVSP
jgi:hypothetical protein